MVSHTRVNRAEQLVVLTVQHEHAQTVFARSKEKGEKERELLSGGLDLAWIRVESEAGTHTVPAPVPAQPSRFPQSSRAFRCAIMAPLQPPDVYRAASDCMAHFACSEHSQSPFCVMLSGVARHLSHSHAAARSAVAKHWTLGTNDHSRLLVAKCYFLPTTPLDMESVVIEAWVDEVTTSCSAQLLDKSPTADPLNTNSRRRRLSVGMASPLKRQRTDNNPVDPDETPTRPPQSLRQVADGAVFDDRAETASSTRSTSSFTAVLASRAAFSASTAAAHPPTNTSHSTTRSRSLSPVKQFRSTASLLSLVRPVRFTKASDLGSVLPGDAQKLFEVLSAVEAKVEILPAALRGSSEFGAARIRDFMWKSDEEDQPLACDTISGNHARFRDVVNDSIASSNLHRSEAAWNNLVHTPLLRHATSHFDFLQVEPITSARIMPAFRPLSKAGDQSLSSSISSASSMSEQDLGTPQTRSGTVASSVHKMVDFALVLQPKEGLQNLIDTFLDTQPHTTATINQTIYEPLRTRPAPIFIETKTSLGNIDAANVQLGVWVAAWHDRMRSIISLAEISSKIITIPVIQVVGSVWTVMFVKDTDAEIQILDGNFRIGDTDSILGIYQLQAAISALADWTKETFEPWLTMVLSRVTASKP
ncbi:hypothetical protein PCL_07392 [Purpureocillium lilacinum]|uniref:PD-(D/E)XK nuclease-like domain-containing protein n=1 Tax=Purpureocillium lilacinum TaxID=33203 RepID=A0A2U3DS63_PURLI|nr:hypothetical protein PCL_07392 [Purpureocillium lilacinum]